MAGLSQIAQPGADLRVGHVGPLDALANARVPREIECRETRIGLVPDLGRNLVPAVGVLEPELVLGAVLDQPIAARIAEPTPEREIETPSDLVDEIIHIRLAAAVVVAGEQQAPVAVQKDPAGEVDRANARKESFVVDVARTVIDEPENDDRHPAAEPARF